MQLIVVLEYDATECVTVCQNDDQFFAVIWLWSLIMPTGKGACMDGNLGLGVTGRMRNWKERNEKKNGNHSTGIYCIRSSTESCSAFPYCLFPLISYLDSHVTALVYYLSKHPLLSSWTFTFRSPLTLCKLRVQLADQGSCVDIITIKGDFEWTLSFMNQQLGPNHMHVPCPL